MTGQTRNLGSLPPGPMSRSGPRPGVALGGHPVVTWLTPLGHTLFTGRLSPYAAYTRVEWVRVNWGTLAGLPGCGRAGQLMFSMLRPISRSRWP